MDITTMDAVRTFCLATGHTERKMK